MNDSIYPELSEDGKREAQALIDKFKGEISKLVENALGDFYCDVACHIESDSWTNYKNHLMDGLSDYNNRRDYTDHDYKRIRQSILSEHRADLISDLNQDLLQQVEGLEMQIEMHRKAY